MAHQIDRAEGAAVIPRVTLTVVKWAGDPPAPGEVREPEEILRVPDDGEARTIYRRGDTPRRLYIGGEDGLARPHQEEQ